ncbi:metallophosphoesterase [Neobacillus sp. NPDC058068]|uniref:metallophosphoesterase n=1 Tax=Neobacillus sp. NPDC058068 TaxID=3346325 RepID=UPI0036DD3071
MDKIKQLSIPKHARVIVISDIHGELALFKALLEKVQFGTEDYLIINGDLCEKGSNSKGVVSYVMELAATNPKVYVIEGNCETLMEELLNENPQLLGYLRARKDSIFHEWLEQIGVEVTEETTIQSIKECLTKYLSKEIEWLTALPTAIETDEYIFVHAGIADIDDWKQTERDTAVSLPTFLEKSHRSDKYVVVGHWPVGNYSTDVLVHNPIIQHEKKIIAIDGGNNVKESGQLNALIIQTTNNETAYSFTYVDHYPTCKIGGDFKADPKMSGSISYPFYEIVPVEKGNHFTLCKQPGTNQQRYVKNEYIHRNEKGQFQAKTDISCAQISVKKGDVVSLLDDSCSGYNLIKKDGAVGWMAKNPIRS